MPLPSHKTDNNRTAYTSINSSLDALQALFAHINQDNESELDADLYFKTPVVKHRRTNGEDDLDWILNWWQSHEAEYPIMSQVARDYLAIPASEVDVERLFSISRDLIGLQRHSLSIDPMRAIMMIKSLRSISL
jgi:hypothetical protein